MRTIEGALFGKHDPDSRQTGGPEMWCWSVPLCFDSYDEDDHDYEEGIPNENAGRLVFEGATFSELVQNATAGLKVMGFAGEACMVSICHRFTYAVIGIGVDGSTSCDTPPWGLAALEEMGLEED